MKRAILIIYIIQLFLVISVSCKNNVDNSYSLKSKYTIKINDSIMINKPILRFEDQRNDKFLFINNLSGTVVVYDKKNNKIESFNKFGNGDKEYNVLNSGSVKFLNDSIIGVGLYRNILKYNFKGKFKGNISINTQNSYATITGFHLFKDSILVIQTPYIGNPNKRDFFKSKESLFLVKNLETQKVFKAIKYFLINKDNLSNDDFHFQNIYKYPYYTTKNTYCFTNSNANHLYTFNIDSLKITKITPLNLKNYKPLKIKYGVKLGMDDKIINVFRSSDILAVFEPNEKTYVFYTEGYTLDEMKKYKKEHIDFPLRDVPKYKFNINRFSKNKMIDIKVSSKIGVPIFVDKKDNIYIEKYPTEKSDINGNTIIYVCKIVENE